MSFLRLAYSRQILRPLSRSLAEIVPAQPHQFPRTGLTKAESSTSTRVSRNSRVSVREDHGLYAFFRRRTGENLTGEDRYEVVEPPEEGRLISGRAWEASELRLKSFKDLHTLWYVAAREQNLLASQKEEARRMGVSNVEQQVSMEKVRNCRKTMAHIKAVLSERRLAYEGAIKLAEQQMAAAKARIVDEADQAVMEFQRAQQEDEARIYPTTKP